MQRPDPELLPIQRPRCPKCQMRMISAGVTPESEGFESRTFECMKCGHTETRRLLADPIKSDAVVGWIKGELGSPN